MKIDGLSNLSVLDPSTLIQSKSEEKFDELLQANLKKIENEEKSKTKLYEACLGLESVFINQMLQAMQKTVPESSLIGNSFATETFQGMLFEEYSKTMNQQQSFGIADALYQQLAGEKYKG